MVFRQLGARNQPKKYSLENTVYNNIDKIRLKEYLSAMKAVGLINEDIQVKGRWMNNKEPNSIKY